jgi:formyltetrahydrofolate deformylase
MTPPIELRHYILTLSCPDTTGIVYHVSKFLFDSGCNIVDSAQFGDSSTGLFFLRMHFSTQTHDKYCDVTNANVQDDPLSSQLARLKHAFLPVAAQFGMQWDLFDAHIKPRLMLLVSKFGHCLNDLLFRYKSGQLHCEIPAIVSNHTDFALLSASYGIPFYHLPVNPNNKTQQETQILQILEREHIDLLVLARYMQVLSPQMCQTIKGRAINIHHSFLPSFKGAKPYQQAYNRGVKLIGATAHYVTSELDEGPIIEQDVARVDHGADPQTITAIGRDVESQVLARALGWHCEHRVLLNGHKTVVFK